MKKGSGIWHKWKSSGTIRACLPFILLIGFTITFTACRQKTGSGEKKQGWFGRIFKSKGKKAVPYSREIQKVIEEARSYTGTPHRDGGTNRYGIDCSALIQNSFKAAGINLPRTSRQQSEAGLPVDRKNLRPGDLVFFSDSKIGKGITHVGMVTEILPNGDVKFIHTSSRLGVTENLLSTSYFTKTYAKAMRPF